MLPVTARMRELLDQIDKTVDLILEIDGLSTLIASGPVGRIARYGDPDIPFYGDDPDFKYGRVYPITDQKQLISFDGTSTKLTGQIDLFDQSSGSVQSLVLRLIDLNGWVTELISPGVLLPDILSRKCKLSMALRGGSHPEDSIMIMSGVIDQITAAAGYIDFTLRASDQFKRQALFQNLETELTADINDLALIIPVQTTQGFVAPNADAMLLCYIQVEDELMKVSTVGTTSFIVAERGALGTAAVSHDTGSSVTSFYRLQGDALDCALKLMLSGIDTPWKSGLAISRLGYSDVATLDVIPNAIFFDRQNVGITYSIVPGDLVTITGATTPANNVTDATVVGVDYDDDKSWVIVDEAIVPELSGGMTLSIKSQYNTLPLGAGLGIDPDQIDIAQFQFLQETYGAQIPEIDLYLKSTISGYDLIDGIILHDIGFFSVPRKGKISANILAAPLGVEGIAVFDESSVMNPADLKLIRSTRSNFANHVVLKYNEDTITDDMLSTYVFQSADSLERINAGTIPLSMKLLSLKSGSSTAAFLPRLGLRLLDRYQFGAEQVSFTTSMRDGFTVELSDAVVFGSSFFSLPDIRNGSRSFEPRIFQCVSRDLDLATGRVDLTLIDTSLSIDGRYGIFSPSSFIAAGASATKLPLQRSFNTRAGSFERNKWLSHLGEAVAIRSADHSVAYLTTILSVGGGSDDSLTVATLPAIPSAGMLVEIASYDNVTAASKNLYCFFDPTLTIISGVSETVFTVSLSDAAKLFAGCIVKVHNVDYSTQSDEVKVTSIASDVITVDNNLGFVPSSGMKINLIGFSSDQGAPYRFL